MSAPRTRADGRPWRVVMLLVGAGVVAAFQVGKVPIALPAIQRDLDLGLAAAAWLVSAFAVVGAVAGAPIGLMADRVGAHRLAVISLVLMAGGAAIGTSLASPAVLLASRVVEGFGFLGLTVAAPALIAAAAPGAIRERAMALWATFMPVGMTLVMLAAPLLSAVGWRAFWLVNAGLLVGYAGLLAWGSRRTGIRDPGPARDVMRDVRDAAGAAGPWLLAGLFAVFSAAYFAVFGLLPTYLAERLRMAADASAMTSAVAVLASAVGNLLCGHLLVRGVRPARLLFGAFGVIAFCGDALFHPLTADAAILPLAMALSFAGGAIPVVIFDSVSRFAPRHDLVGATMGFAMQGNSVGLIVGPAAAGALAAAFGWHAVGGLVMAIAVTGIVLAAAFKQRDALELRRGAAQSRRYSGSEAGGA